MRKSKSTEFTCRSSSGVEIIPPHLVTLARGRVADHRTTSSLSIWSVIALIAGLETPMALIKSLSKLISLLCSLIWNCCSPNSLLMSFSFWCCDCMRFLSSLTQLWSFSSSLGIIRLHPCSHGIGLFGLNSQSSRWDARLSSFMTVWQPKLTLSQFMQSRANRFLNILGTGRSWAEVIGVRSSGHVGWWFIHSFMQTLQKACSQTGACNTSLTYQFSKKLLKLQHKHAKARICKIYNLSNLRKNSLQSMKIHFHEYILSKFKHISTVIYFVNWKKLNVTWTGSSRTPEHIGQTSSSSTSPWNLLTSKPIASLCWVRNSNFFDYWAKK